jgi:hypothetical protein
MFDNMALLDDNDDENLLDQACDDDDEFTLQELE